MAKANGKWWEYMIPGWNTVRFAQDAYDNIKETYDNVSNYVTKKKNDNAMTYAASNDRVKTARENLDRIKAEGAPGKYQSEYASQISGTQDALNKMNEKGFAYDYTKDLAYQQYKSRLSALQSQDQLALEKHQLNANNYWDRLNSAQTEYADAVAAKQQKTANTTNTIGNVATLAAQALPWVLRAFGVAI